MADTEIWKDIEGYEGLYQVSNQGRVRSNARGKTKLMNQNTLPNGYSRIHINYKGTHTYLFVHRLVAKAFIPNLNNLPQVNHKDENKLNNHADNLEWCDAKYNSNYGTGRKRLAKKIRKPIIQMDLEGKEIMYWFSETWAAESAGTDLSNIYKCLAGKRTSAGGYMWKRSDNTKNPSRLAREKK